MKKKPKVEKPKSYTINISGHVGLGRARCAVPGKSAVTPKSTSRAPTASPLAVIVYFRKRNVEGSSRDQPKLLATSSDNVSDAGAGSGPLPFTSPAAKPPSSTAYPNLESLHINNSKLVHGNDVKPSADVSPKSEHVQNPTSNSEPIHNISQVSVPPSLTSSFKGRPGRDKKSAASPPRAAVTFLGSSSVSGMAQRIGQNHVELAEDLYDASATKNLDSVELEILKLRGVFLLPSRELTLDLIELYFEHVHPLLPIINRTDFMAKVNDTENPPSLMLLHAVLLCGSRVSNNSLIFDSKGLSNLTSLTFFRRAKALYDMNYESDPVTIVQTVILLGTYWEGPEDVTRNSYYWTRVAVGLAQGFGFHRDAGNYAAISSVERKNWRRIWWCLFEKDRNVAIAFGRPTTIDLTDCDVSMLTLDDFNEDDPENGVVSPYPVNRVHALYFIHLVKLAEITGIIIKHQYTVRAEQKLRINKVSIIQRCDMLMGIWFTNLPEELQFSLTDPNKQNFFGCLLNAQYYNRLYLIHRANLLRMAKSSSTNPSNYKYPSWGISFQAARMISIVSKILMDKGMVKYCPVMFVYVLYSSLIMLIFHIDSTNSVIASTASDSLFISRSVLKELGKYWPIVRVLLRLFDKHANDKIKRARIIEKESLTAEFEDRKGEQAALSSTYPANGVSEDLTHMPTTPKMNQGSMQPPSQIRLPNRTTVPISNPNIEDLVRQFKSKSNGVPDRADAKKSSSTSDVSPASQTSFPDVSLVTEAFAPNDNFMENFEPTQLFPMLNSNPISRAESPLNYQLKKDEDHPLFNTHPGSSMSLNENGELLTNFVDNMYLNMNLQCNAEDDMFLNEDVTSAFHYPSEH